MDALNNYSVIMNFRIGVHCLRDLYEPLLNPILDKVNHDLLDFKKVFNHACTYGCLDVGV